MLVKFNPDLLYRKMTLKHLGKQCLPLLFLIRMLDVLFYPFASKRIAPGTKKIHHSWDEDTMILPPTLASRNQFSKVVLLDL